MFAPNFRERLKTGKYTSWACDLTEDQLEAVLWVVGEYGYRGPSFSELIDSRVSENDQYLIDEVGYARLRLALRLLEQMTNGKRFTMAEIKANIRDGLRRFRPDETVPFEQGNT